MKGKYITRRRLPQGGKVWDDGEWVQAAQAWLVAGQGGHGGCAFNASFKARPGIWERKPPSGHCLAYSRPGEVLRACRATGISPKEAFMGP